MSIERYLHKSTTRNSNLNLDCIVTVGKGTSARNHLLTMESLDKFGYRSPIEMHDRYRDRFRRGR